MFSVLVAEHDDALLKKLRAALRSSDFAVEAEESTAVGAVASAVRLRPDVCIVDSEIPGGSMAAVWEISARLPDTKIVMLRDSCSDRELVASLALGVSGYVRADLSLKRLTRVLAAVMDGEVAIPRSFVAQLAGELREGSARRRSVVTDPDSTRLTSREWEVMGMLCEGFGTSAIARRLSITQATVRSHVSRAVGKIGAPDRRSAVRVLNRR